MHARSKWNARGFHPFQRQHVFQQNGFEIIGILEPSAAQGRMVDRDVSARNASNWLH